MGKNIYITISEFVRIQLFIVYIYYYYQFSCEFDRTGLAIFCNQEVLDSGE